MNKRDAFKQAKLSFPGLKPTLAAGFGVDDGLVEIPLWDVNNVLVLYNLTDLFRMKSACEIAIANLTAKKSRKKND